MSKQTDTNQPENSTIKNTPTPDKEVNKGSEATESAPLRSDNVDPNKNNDNEQYEKTTTSE